MCIQTMPRCLESRTGCSPRISFAAQSHWLLSPRCSGHPFPYSRHVTLSYWLDPLRLSVSSLVPISLLTCSLLLLVPPFELKSNFCWTPLLTESWIFWTSSLNWKLNFWMNSPKQNTHTRLTNTEFLRNLKGNIIKFKQFLTKT